MLASSRGRLSHIQSLEKRYDIRSAGAQCTPLRSYRQKHAVQYIFGVFDFCLPVRYPIPIFILIFYYILKFFRRSLFFKKGWKAPVNNHFAGQRLSAGIMAQRAAESFSVIFMWRQLGR